MSAKASSWQVNPDRPHEGWATFYCDGERFDIGIDADGRFTFEGAPNFVLRPNSRNETSVAEKLEEIAATFRDAAKMERARLQRKNATHRHDFADGDVCNGCDQLRTLRGAR